MNKPRIGITIGDFRGIGPEVIIKSLNTSIRTICTPVIFGNIDIIKKQAKNMGLAFNKSIDVVNVKAKKANELAYSSLKLAIEHTLRRSIDCIVTAPLSKSVFNSGGHTEMLASLTKTKKVAMMFVAGNFRVVIATRHIPIKKVSNCLNQKLLGDTIELTETFLKRYLGIYRPRIGVCALNPHGSEVGDEEENLIIPLIKKNVCIKGPFSADTIFLKREEFDAVISMYHDQGLIPFKLLAFNKGVNVTLGLPFIRTSPDHGTAYDIAGKGVANPSSMICAIKLACSMYAKINQNTIKRV